jgi:hypothetical protein
VVQTPLSLDQLTSVIPGALKMYDLPELAALLAPRPLSIRQAVDAAGKRLTQAVLESAWGPARAAYGRLKAEKSLLLQAELFGAER